MAANVVAEGFVFGVNSTGLVQLSEFDGVQILASVLTFEYMRGRNAEIAKKEMEEAKVQQLRKAAEEERRVSASRLFDNSLTASVDALRNYTE